jgi:hypothetical protein
MPNVFTFYMQAFFKSAGPVVCDVRLEVTIPVQVQIFLLKSKL